MRMKVLIVSRDFRLLSWGSSVLRGAHEVHVLDVLEADGAVPAHPFDVCVVDVDGRDGMRLLDAVRHRCKNTPTIATIAASSMPRTLDAYAHGAVAVLVSGDHEALGVMMVRLSEAQSSRATL
jgi:DNA-binding NtrC family response regulator